MALSSWQVTINHPQVQFSSVTQSCPTLCDPWTTAHQASLSITNSWSLLKLMSIESVMPSNHLILCHPILLSPSIFPSIRVFSNESVFHIRWPKYGSFSFNTGLSNEYWNIRYSLLIFKCLEALKHFFWDLWQFEKTCRQILRRRNNKEKEKFRYVMNA